LLDDKHKLLPGDRRSFHIGADRTDAIRMIVAESSELDLHCIGLFSVVGRPCKQAADELKVLFDLDYFHNFTDRIGLDSLAESVG
jgi:hypothetical protein